MVGDPKYLSDLARIEADVRLTCRRCGYEDDWTVEALSRHLRAIGGNTAWSEVTRHLRCRRFGCGAARLRAAAVPYARRQANLPRRVGRLDEALITTALRILEDASARSPGRNVATLDVRLALLLVHRFIRDPAPVRLLWERAGNAGRTTDEGLSGPLALIRHKLEGQGWIAPPVLIVEPKVWPWNSPAPPGWTAGPGSERDES